MSTNNNICFHGEIKKKYQYFRVGKKVSYLELYDFIFFPQRHFVILILDFPVTHMCASHYTEVIGKVE